MSLEVGTGTKIVAAAVTAAVVAVSGGAVGANAGDGISRADAERIVATQSPYVKDRALLVTQLAALNATLDRMEVGQADVRERIARIEALLSAEAKP
jgi:hypothetical protein